VYDVSEKQLLFNIAPSRYWQQDWRRLFCSKKRRTTS